MNGLIEPLHVQSLKDACVLRLEELILSGEWKPGIKLPPERDLSAKLGISRPVLHEALVDLGAKGLVTITPRRAVRVNDFRKSGSAAILSSLLAYREGSLDPEFVKNLFAMRTLIEVETASLAATHASPKQINELQDLVAAEQNADFDELQVLIDLDYEFHLQVALASGNQVYPLILNSFKSVYTHFTGMFYKRINDPKVIEKIHTFHRELVGAIANRDSSMSALWMRSMLEHGEKLLNT